MGFFRRSAPAETDRRSEYLSAEQLNAERDTESDATPLVTPEQVRNIAFGKPPMGKRGYNEDEVDWFLDEVEATIRELRERLSKYEQL